MRLLSLPLILVILSMTAIGCDQRIPARSQVGQAADGFSPSSVYETPIAKTSRHINTVTAATKKSGDTRHFGTITAKIGEPVQLDETIFAVHGFREVPGDILTGPDPGKKLLAVEVSIVNVGKKPRYFAGVRDLWLRDSTGLMYTNDGMRAVESISFLDDGATVPGQEIRGEVNFEVPKDQDDFRIYFDPVTLELQEFVMVPLVMEDPSWRAAGTQIRPDALFEMPGPKREQQIKNPQLISNYTTFFEQQGPAPVIK